jgi:hypothetical protein
MIFTLERHEALQAQAWDAARAHACIDRIVAGAEAAYVPGQGWPAHPMDCAETAAPLRGLYFGDCGVLWALHCLQARGAVRLRRHYLADLDGLQGLEQGEEGSYLMGETGVLLLRTWLQSKDDGALRLAELIEGNLEHPTRELMWGSPGTMLAA